MARGNKIPKELLRLLLGLAVLIGVILYNNIVIVILTIIGILILIFLWIYYNGFSLNNNRHFGFSNTPSIFTKSLSVILIIILLISFINISSNTEYYKKEFQQGVSNGFTSLAKGFFALRNPRKFIIKEARKDMRENGSGTGNLETNTN